MEKLIINGENLSIEDVFHVATCENATVQVEISKDSLSKMDKSRKFVLDLVEKEKPVYGINTGFGALSNKFIQKKDLEQLQYNLIRSHCTGVGKPFNDEITRAIMLLRANCLCSGYSGINPQIVQLLITFLNKNILPVIPQKGSVGASGDLAPLSHMALALIGEGEVYFEKKRQSTQSVLERLNIQPIKLGPKDGLALINGTAVMAALGCIAVYEAKSIMKIADISAALTLDAVKGTTKAYDPSISKLKPHLGQNETCINLNTLLKDSQIKDSHDDCQKVQDPYSLRCVPQVHGACRQTFYHAEHVIKTEINSVTDNPLIFPDENKVISGGNFHGEAIALCMDYLAMGLSEICSISERRIEKMMNPTFSDLPAFLVKESGLNSGLMIAQVTAAALTSENKYLSHPASVDSIPTSTDKEDHVSMGLTAGRKLQEVLENTKNVLSIELLCNTQALEFQRPLKTSPALEKIYSLIRKKVPPIVEDRTLHKDIEKISKLIKSRKLVFEIEKILGELK
ncbi:MAG: histidine ammonia-lyase [Halobacteriovoraceae bacterium]|nr:histidine ammonia-lyase [Halobacteriovoraceae bacterium]